MSNSNTDLHIKVLSKLCETQQVLIYQEAVSLNVKNFKTAAWEHRYLAPDSEMSVILPMEICMGAYESIGHNGYISTKLLPVEYNTAWEIFNNGNALDVRESNETAPNSDTIDIYNKHIETSSAVVTKDGKPIFKCNVRPGFKVNFSINPKIYVALSDIEITDPFFDAATLSKSPLEIDYEGQEYLTIVLSENESTGAVTINYNFDKFDS